MADPTFAERINAPAAAAPVVLGIAYSDIHYNGSSLVFLWDKPCDGNFGTRDSSYLSFPPAMNDQISSFVAYNNCVVILYENWDRSGRATPPAFSMSYVGDAMNDRASSADFF